MGNPDSDVEPTQSPGWTGALVRYVVFGVTVAAVLWLFSSIREHQDRIVRLEVQSDAQSGTLLEVRNDVKALLQAENRRAGREEGGRAETRASVRTGSSSQ